MIDVFIKNFVTSHYPLSVCIDPEKSRSEISTNMAAEVEVEIDHHGIRCNRCGDAGQEQRRLMSKTDEQTGFPLRVRNISIVVRLPLCVGDST